MKKNKSHKKLSLNIERLGRIAGGAAKQPLAPPYGSFPCLSNDECVGDGYPRDYKRPGKK
jgi:hypothetical protein